MRGKKYNFLKSHKIYFQLPTTRNQEKDDKKNPLQSCLFPLMLMACSPGYPTSAKQVGNLLLRRAIY